MAPLLIVALVLCAAVPLAATGALWPKNWFWLLPLSGLPWLAAGLKGQLGPDSSSAFVMPPTMAVLLPLLAVIVDRWESLRANRVFWAGVAIGSAFLGFHVWGVAAGELWLNHDGQYCREPNLSPQDCPLDPLLAGNVYLTTFGFAVILIGPIPSLILLGCLGYRRWFGRPRS